MGRRRDFWGTIIEGGVVHVAAEEFVLCADDDSLSARSSADDVSVGCECVPVQLAGMPDGVLDGEGVLPSGRRGRRRKTDRIVWAGSNLSLRAGGFSPTLHRGLCGGTEGEILGVPGAWVRVRSLAEIREDRKWVENGGVVRAQLGGEIEAIREKAEVAFGATAHRTFGQFTGEKRLFRVGCTDGVGLE